MTIDISLEATFDCSDLTVIQFKGREAISELFRFEIDVSLLNGTTLPDGLEPSAEIGIVMTRDGTVVRRFYGMIEQIATHRDPTLTRPLFQLTVVPRAARALLIEQQQILMGLSVVDLITDRLELVELGPNDINCAALGSYPKREFIIQYRESDWALLSRYLEHYGICYWFEHEQDGDRIVFADQLSLFQTNTDAPDLHFPLRKDEPEALHSLREIASTIPSHYAVYDYNYRNPTLSLFVDKDVPGHGGAVLEYGAHVKTVADSTLLATVRAEERACRQTVYQGKSAVYSLKPGWRHNVSAQGSFAATELLIESVEHHAQFARFEATDGDNVYYNTFTAVGTKDTYRPKRLTPKPRIHGFITGVVQGASPDAVAALLDDAGRYLVEFHFDASRDRTEASRPCRMMQPFGGTTHGMHFPLRPGTEVAVGFADGDPDRPVVLGALDNATTPSPVNVSNATVNRIVTRSGAAMEIGESQ